QRHVIFDTNVWKSWVHARLGMATGDKGTLSIHGKGSDHAMLADHLTSEYPSVVESKGRKATYWTMRPGRDNHWLDCLVGAGVAASMGGLSSLPAANRKPRGADKPTSSSASRPGRRARQKVSYL